MSRSVRCGNCNYRNRVPDDAVTAKVRIKVQDVIDYYGRSEREKIARCRIAYGR